MDYSSVLYFDTWHWESPGLCALHGEGSELDRIRPFQ